jgi:hypothetical protein
MTRTWTEADLLQLIDDGVEESLQLDYKAADALAPTEAKRKEITKDVSAMANSAGGIVIYGIREFADKERRHLPERIDPLVRSQFSKERLEHIIRTIRPRIEGVHIEPVALSQRPDACAYVVTVPQGSTAHQAMDHRYYRRYNFESVPMEDHEIRDIMGRSQFPKIEIDVEIEALEESTRGTTQQFELIISAKNVGAVYAKYVAVKIRLPSRLVDVWEERFRYDDGDGSAGDQQPDPDGMYRKILKNTRRDIVDSRMIDHAPEPELVYGPSWYDPLLPGMSHQLGAISLKDNPSNTIGPDDYLEYEAYADNAPMRAGNVPLFHAQRNSAGSASD